MVFLERIKDFTIFVAEKSIDMKYSVTLRNLPFEPHRKQVIYVENLYCERMNAQIRDNYSWFKRTFRQARLDFVYLPMFFKDVEIKEKVLYYAPYLTEEILSQTELQSDYLLDFMTHPENREKIQPSLLYAPKKDNGEWVFSGLTIDTETEDWIATMQHFSTLISEIKQDTAPTIHFKEIRSDGMVPVPRHALINYMTNYMVITCKQKNGNLLVLKTYNYHELSINFCSLVLWSFGLNKH